MSDGWEERPLGELVYDVKERVSPNDRPDDPYVALEHLASGRRFPVRYALASTAQSQKTRYREGDVLFGKLRPYLKKVAIAEGDGVCSTDILALRTHSSSALCAGYAYYLLASDHVLDYAVEVSAGTRMPRVSFALLSQLRVPVPPLAEQRRIADLMNAVDERIRLSDEALTRSERVRTALHDDLLPTSHPEWNWRPLDELVTSERITLGRGKVISKPDMAADPGDYPVYSSSVSNEGLFGTYGSYLFDEELITWSVDGGGHLFHRDKHKFSVTNVSGFMRVVDPEIDCRFLAAQLQAQHRHQHYDYQSKAHPSVIRHAYKVGLPDIVTQRRIAGLMRSVDANSSALRDSAAATKRLRTALLQDLLSGEHEIPESYDRFLEDQGDLTDHAVAPAEAA